MNRSRCLLWGWIVIIALTGCGASGPTKQEQAIATIDEHRDAARTRLARFVELAKKITPEFTAPAWPEHFEPTPVYYLDKPEWNLACAGRQDLLTMKHVLDTGDDSANYIPQFRDGGPANMARTFWQCAEHVARKEHKVYYDLEEVQQAFERVEQVRYLLVFADPSELTGEADLKNKTFTSGLKAASGFLFDLESGECLGTFRVSAASSASVNVGDGSSVGGALEGDISGNFAMAINDEMARRFPYVRTAEGEEK